VFPPRSNCSYARRHLATSLLFLFVVFLTGCASASQHAPATAPVLELSARSFHFNSIVVGKTASQRLHITNSGTAPLTIRALSLESQHFSITGPSVPRTVLPSQKVDYTITFAPTSDGTLSASLSIISNADTTPSAISLAGTAEKAFAALQATPSAVNFGNLKLKTTSTQNVTLKNTGDIKMTVSGVTISGKGFGYSSLSPGFALSPSQAVTFQVWFKPQEVGTSTGNVSIISANIASPINIPVSGGGVGATSNPPPSNPPPSNPPPSNPPSSNPPPGNTPSGNPPPNNPPSSNPPSSGAPAPSHSVTLSWEPSASTEVVGYNVYRSTSPGTGFSLLTQLLNTLTFKDENVADGSTYYYVVTSLNGAGDESEHSNEATAVIPLS